MGRIRNSLRVTRQSAGLSQEALSEAVGISRQAYRAIETGESVPSTEVALRLARALGAPVERLFALPEDPRPTVIVETVGSPLPTGPGRRVRLTRVGGRLLARPLTGGAGIVRVLSWADGVGTVDPANPSTATVELLHDLVAAERTLVMLGCDPSAAILATALQERGIELIWTEEGSLASLQGLARGEAHVAGCHLRDPDSGVANLPWVARIVPFPCTVIRFAVWQQGLMVAPGNSFDIQGVGDLARAGVTLVNRAPGTGARMLLDQELARLGIPTDSVRGYERVLPGHLAVAEAISAGLVDVGVGVRAAAIAAELDFLPLDEEHYDLIVPNHFLDLPSVSGLLDILRRPGLRDQVESLGGYDAATMGDAISVTPAPAEGDAQSPRPPR